MCGVGYAGTRDSAGVKPDLPHIRQEMRRDSQWAYDVESIQAEMTPLASRTVELVGEGQSQVLKRRP